MLDKKRFIIGILFSILSFIILSNVYLFFPTEDFSIKKLILVKENTIESNSIIYIFYNRLIKLLMAILAGGSLSLVGLIMQVILRNPLTDPYILGISSAGSFGAIISIKLGLDFTILGFIPNILFSIFFVFICIIILWGIIKLKGYFSPNILILSGVSLNFFFGSLILLFQYISSYSESISIIRWLMGSLEYGKLHHILFILLFLIPVFIFFFINSKSFNIISLGRDNALAKGVNYDKIQKISLVLISVLTGIIVSITGPIGFVGLIVPHLLRLIFGYDLRILIPNTFLLGATFLIFSSLISSNIISEIEIPIGVITSLFGAPFFLWLLLNKSKL